MENRRIMFVGPSGIGKTTSAKYISEVYDIPFLSGSVSDLLPETKTISHKDMLNRDPKLLVLEDYKIIQLRHKLYKQYDSFVSDRSYIDSMAYFIYKQSTKIPQCEIDQFIKICLDLLLEDCTHVIFFKYPAIFLKTWAIEDNDKRITNGYYQMLMSSIMEDCLDIIKNKFINLNVLVVDTPDMDSRHELIRQFIL